MAILQLKVVQKLKQFRQQCHNSKSNMLLIWTRHLPTYLMLEGPYDKYL